MTDDQLVEVIITAPDEDWLIKFTRKLVEDRLAACGHHTPIRSIYTWDGQHPRSNRNPRRHPHPRRPRPAIIDRTNAEHPYEVACVIATPIVDANPGTEPGSSTPPPDTTPTSRTETRSCTPTRTGPSSS